MHEKNFIHRDLKPENILINKGDFEDVNQNHIYKDFKINNNNNLKNQENE